MICWFMCERSIVRSKNNWQTVSHHLFTMVPHNRGEEVITHNLSLRDRRVVVAEVAGVAVVAVDSNSNINMVVDHHLPLNTNCKFDQEIGLVMNVVAITTAEERTVTAAKNPEVPQSIQTIQMEDHQIMDIIIVGRIIVGHHHPIII